MKNKITVVNFSLCLGIFFPPPVLNAAVIPAASCSETDVQNAVNQSQSGDTVMIPA